MKKSIILALKTLFVGSVQQFGKRIIDVVGSVLYFWIGIYEDYYSPEDAWGRSNKLGMSEITVSGRLISW